MFRGAGIGGGRAGRKGGVVYGARDGVFRGDGVYGGGVVAAKGANVYGKLSCCLVILSCLY